MADLIVFVVSLVLGLYWMYRAWQRRLPGHEDEGPYYGNVDSLGRRYLARSMFFFLFCIIITLLLRVCSGD